MAYQHGVYFVETSTNFQPPISSASGIVIAVGTAPIHLATNPAAPNVPVLATRLSEAVTQLGWSDDFDRFTLAEVMQTNLSLYTVAPLILINVLDPAKHYNEINDVEIGGLTSAAATIEGDIDLSSFKITSGEYVAPTKLTAEEDFTVEVTEADDSDTDNIIAAATTLKILDGDKVENNKIVVTYKTEAGGDAITTEVTLAGITFSLPTDTVVSTVAVETGGVDTLQELERDVDYRVEYLASTVTLTLLDDSKVIDDTVKVSYHEIDPSKVTVADIIGGIDIATGQATGIEAIDTVFPRLRVVPGTLIAPKYSLDMRVANALSAKAQAVSGQFPAMAVVDIDSSLAKTYTAAIELKNQRNLNDSHTIVCWPKVRNGAQEYYMSSHIAALMTQTDARNGDIPFVSPSNQPLAISATVTADGTEVFLTRDQANILNGAGVMTAISYNGYRAWGSRTAAYDSTSDPKDAWIPVRRVFNFVTTTLAISYLSRLDQPLTRRALDSLMFSAKIWLASLVTRGALIAGDISLSPDLTVMDLMDGIVRLRLSITPPSPMRAITYTLSYNVAALESLLGAGVVEG